MPKYWKIGEKIYRYKFIDILKVGKEQILMVEEDSEYLTNQNIEISERFIFDILEHKIVEE